MSVWLDWQLDADEDEDLDWGPLEARGRPESVSFPGYCGIERNPELLRIWFGSYLAGQENPVWLYLAGSLVAFLSLIVLLLLI